MLMLNMTLHFKLIYNIYIYDFDNPNNPFNCAFTVNRIENLILKLIFKNINSISNFTYGFGNHFRIGLGSYQCRAILKTRDIYFVEYMAFWDKYNFKMALDIIKTRDLIQATLKLKVIFKNS